MALPTHSQAAGSCSEPLLDATIGQAFDSTAARFPEVEALVVRHQGIRWTYAEYLREIEKLAAGLLALGIGAGDRVGIWSPHGYEWCLTQFATAKIGAILVNINPAYRVFELEYALKKSGCRAVIAAEQFKSSHYLEMLSYLAPELTICAPGRLHAQKLPQLETVIRMGAGRTPGAASARPAASGRGPRGSSHPAATAGRRTGPGMRVSDLFAFCSAKGTAVCAR